jgi:pimeloyl-ACP methyl ester carboxylesterase
MAKSQDVPYSNMAFAGANGIEIVYDAFGDPASPPVLLIGGLGHQLIAWDEDFCGDLAGHGYLVIRFDNRDVGFSTSFEQWGLPNIPALHQAWLRGERILAPYTLRDMAADAVGLLDALEVEDTHLVGISMGGMVAQIIAIHYPERVRTLASIMSSTSDRDLPPPDPEVLSILLQPRPTDRSRYIARAVETARALSGPAYPADEDRVRMRAAQSFDRDPNPTGAARQLTAVFAADSRRWALSAVNVPALVIHGDADPVFPIQCGIDTAQAIPTARLRVIGGLGHGLPPEVWPKLIAAFTRHAP